MSRLDQFWGANDIDRMFPEQNPRTMNPFPEPHRSQTRGDYDPARVKAVLMHPDRHETVHVDPRSLQSAQAYLTRSGVKHYLGDEYERTGKTFADQHNAGNRMPVVYHREDDNAHLLLSGNHRAAAALLQGRQFPVRLVSGGWGPSQ
jgi:hypothetical protein